MGIREYLSEQALCLIEWADKGRGVLPPADLIIHISDAGQGRDLSWQAGSVRGQDWAQQLDRLAREWLAL